MERAVATGLGASSDGMECVKPKDSSMPRLGISAEGPCWDAGDGDAVVCYVMPSFPSFMSRSQLAMAYSTILVDHVPAWTVQI